MDSKIEFNCSNHDEILWLVDKIKANQDFDEQTAMQFTLGLKLLGEVILDNPIDPLCKELKPLFANIMKTVKGRK